MYYQDYFRCCRYCPSPPSFPRSSSCGVLVPHLLRSDWRNYRLTIVESIPPQAACAPPTLPPSAPTSSQAQDGTALRGVGRGPAFPLPTLHPRPSPGPIYSYCELLNPVRPSPEPMYFSLQQSRRPHFAVAGVPVSARACLPEIPAPLPLFRWPRSRVSSPPPSPSLVYTYLRIADSATMAADSMLDEWQQY